MDAKLIASILSDEAHKGKLLAFARYNVERYPDNLNKLINGKAYSSRDMHNSARNVIDKVYWQGYNDQYRILSDINRFNVVFQYVEIKLNQPWFIIFGKPKEQWVLFCVIQDDRQSPIKILFKDPSGADISPELKKKLDTRFLKPTFIVHTSKEQEENEDNTYGPITLRNLDIMLKKYKANAKDFVKNFQKMTFTTLNDIKKCVDQKLIQKNAIELGNNFPFKYAFQRFLSDIPIKTNEQTTKFEDAIKKEMSNVEGKIKFKLDHANFQRARSDLPNENELNKLKNSYKIEEKKGGKKGDLEMEIVRRFPIQWEQIDHMFKTFDKIKIDSNFKTVITGVCKKLGVPDSQLQKLYEIKRKAQPAEEEVPKPTPIALIKLKDPRPFRPDPTATPLPKLLEYLTLGKDGEETSAEDKKELERKFHLVRDKYKKWENKNKYEINNWAKQTRERTLGETDDEVLETIAIMDRAFNLLQTYRMQDTQILAILIFLNNENGRGKLIQIQTGQGKTFIVSFLAVIRVLQGKTVDVITSNDILATEGVTETKNFFSMFELTVDTNNPPCKFGYKPDIIYGNISNFQFDYLRDTFERSGVREDRKFDQVIIDEVDSMLVDNGTHIAKLSTPYPGMDCLRYIYIKIWQELEKAKEKFSVIEKKKSENILNTNNPKAEQAFENYLGSIIRREEEFITNEIKASKPTDIPMIPKHLKNYVKSKEDAWIKNAIYAKFNCHEHEQYRIIENENKEMIVAPVDNKNTGVTMADTIWSLGLHQFVQLKHNLRLTYESLTSSFMSNLGYIKLYDCKNICGMTGTLGSEPEQNLLFNIYKIDYAKIPTYNETNFKELDGIITEDETWSTTVTVEILEKRDENRAVLVICETEKDLLELEKILKSKVSAITLYSNEKHAAVKNRPKVKPGDVILATNIAGRGTNFKTDETLEANGGLHVCVGFLPCNERVEKQAFGRTSRQGNKGTARLIIRRREVDKLDIGEEDPDFPTIKSQRDMLEENRLEDIDKIKVKEIHFNDKIFSIFSEHQREWQNTNNTPKDKIVLKDLREFWAFWLDEKNFTAKNIEGKTPETEYEIFKNAAAKTLEGNIRHNPFNNLGVAALLLDQNEKAEATKALEDALNLGEKKGQLAGIHMKLFEIVLNKESVVIKMLQSKLAQFFPQCEFNVDSRKKALEHVENAKAAIDLELDYIHKNIIYVKKEEGKEPEVNLNEDFQNILVIDPEKNPFFLNFRSRFSLLREQETYLGKLLDDISHYTNIIPEATILTTEKDYKDEVVTHFEINELNVLGINSLYTLQAANPTDLTMLALGVSQILAGAAILGACLIFPVIAIVGKPAAELLIMEGISDCVIAVCLPRGPKEEFHWQDYLIGKALSAGMAVASFGFGSIAKQVTKVATRVESSFRALKKFLDPILAFVKKMREVLKDVMKFLTQKIKAALDKLKTKLIFKISTAADKIIGSTTKNVLKKLGKYAGNKVALNLTKTFVIQPLLGEACEKLKKFVKGLLMGAIKKIQDLYESIKSNIEDFMTSIQDFLKSEIFESTAGKLGFKALEHSENILASTISLCKKLIGNAQKFKELESNLTNYMKDKKKAIRQIVQSELEKNIQVFEECCGQVVDKLFDNIYIGMGSTSTIVATAYGYGKQALNIAKDIKNGKMPPIPEEILAKVTDKIEEMLPDEITDTLNKLKSTAREYSQALLGFKLEIPTDPAVKKFYELLGITSVDGLRVADLILKHQAYVKKLCTDYAKGEQVMTLAQVEAAFGKVIKIYKEKAKDLANKLMERAAKVAKDILDKLESKVREYSQELLEFKLDIPTDPEVKKMYELLGITSVDGLTVTDLVSKYQEYVNLLCTDYAKSKQVLKLPQVEATFEKVIKVYKGKVEDVANKLMKRAAEDEQGTKKLILAKGEAEGEKLLGEAGKFAGEALAKGAGEAIAKG